MPDTEAEMEKSIESLVCLFLSNSKILARRTSGDRYEIALLRSGEALDWIRRATERIGSAGKAVLVDASEGRALYFVSLATRETPDALAAEAWRALSLLEFYELSDLDQDWLSMIRANAIRIPYLYQKPNDYIYRFRAEAERNRKVYQTDEESISLYHSTLCDAIKAVKRGKERTATTPAFLDFGATQFLLPSHFGFCLGVQNAIERAYETIAANPGKRVFMLSELIHNPFVNEDLKNRGLKYLQTDKGAPLIDEQTGQAYWDSLREDDIVIIPAFGARDEDKLRLIERGMPIRDYDATCMLVEKVWKAARRYGEQGYTIVIHGKAEHEETKATFSNSAKHAPSIIIRDIEEAGILARIIEADDAETKINLFEQLKQQSSPGFDPERDLERLALVNQTTLLRNETLKIIAYLEGVLAAKYGLKRVEEHLAMSSKGDTLCYATQVNQDALTKALSQDIDLAIVVGGKNSSNTYQLFRLCEERFGERAFYVQSEANILSKDRIQHFVFPYDTSDPRQGVLIERNFLPDRVPARILVTGGASCPDGILQQIICRINGFFASESIRPIEELLEEIEAQQ